ncbi:MAG: CvpA family protein [Bryobacteraceae bacterium]|jgi:membrane protein required for colicin V production
MNWLDFVLALIVVVSVVSSFRKGLSREIIGLASVVLGLLLGIWFYGTASIYMQPYFNSPLAAKLAGFFLVFTLVFLTGVLLRFVVGKFLRVTKLSIVDHLLGAGFGAARGLLIAVALLTGIMAFARDGRPPASVTDSRLAPYISQGARVFVAMAPHELKEGFRRTYAEAKSAWNSAVQNRTHSRPKAEKDENEKRI